MCRWIDIRKEEPDDDSLVVFVARDGITYERIGIVVKERRILILKRTDISFDDIRYFIQLPEVPEF